MALSRSEILRLYQTEVDSVLVSQRIEQMYNLLTNAQKNVVWPAVKSDLSAALNSDRADLVIGQNSTNTTYNTAIIDVDSKLADVAASVP